MTRTLALLGLVALLPAVASTTEQQPPYEIPERMKALAVRSYSLPVSPTVMASVATRQDRLLALVLWRGGVRWYRGAPNRQYGGGDGKGTISIGLQYGAADGWFSRIPGTEAVTIQETTSKVAADANVFLVDGLGTRDGAKLVKGFFLDAHDATLDFSNRTLAPLLRLSPDIIEFLQCDAVPPQQMNRLDVCPELMRIREGRIGSRR